MNKLFIRNIILIIIYSVTLFLIASFTIYTFTKNKVISDIKLINNSIINDINNKVTNISRLSTNIFLNAEFQVSISKLNDFDSQDAYDIIYSKMSDIIMFDSLISDVAFYPLDENTIKKDNRILLSSRQNLIDTNYGQFLESFEDSLNQRGRLIYLNIFNENNFDTNYIALARVVLGNAQGKFNKPIGYGVFLINKIQLFSKLDEFQNENLPTTLILDEINYYGVTPRADLFELRFSVSEFDWKIITYFNDIRVLNEIKPFLSIYIATFIIFIVSIITIIVFTNYKDSKNYYLFIKTFKDIKEGNLNKKMQYTTNKPIDEVVRYFNEMMDSINELNDLVVDEKTKLLRLQIESDHYLLRHLNSEINQHFLYNTFSIIRSLINLNMREEAANVIENLSEVLRYGLSQDNIVTLKQELDSVQAYVNIQQFRKPNIIVKFNVDEKLINQNVPKFIIQPIIENSYKHGFINDIGNINITIKKKQNLVITISDDGIGITNQKLRQIQKELNSDEHELAEINIGLALLNIKKRLKLLSIKSDLKVSGNENGFTTKIIIEG